MDPKEGFQIVYGRNYVKLKIVCPKSMIFNNGGTCSWVPCQWVYESCKHNTLMNDEGDCICSTQGCKDKTFIANLRFNCKAATHSTEYVGFGQTNFLTALAIMQQGIDAQIVDGRAKLDFLRNLRIKCENSDLWSK